MVNGMILATIVLINIYIVTLYPIGSFKRFSESEPQIKRTNSVKDNNNQCWEDVVSQDTEILHSFMRFLVRRFCVENMLFIIETMQFKQAIIRNKDEHGKNEVDYGIIIRLYDEEHEMKRDAVPRSTIVYGDNNDYTLMEQIRMIYDKYVSEHASLQINIPFDTRHKLQQSIFSEDLSTKGVDDEVLIKCFDECIEEVRILLTGLFTRFASNGKYAKNVDGDGLDINEQIIITMQQQCK